MKKLALSLVAATVVSTGVFAEDTMASEVELSANVAMTSNYVWRGMTQNSNTVAVQGGFDVAYKGFYAGVWGSPVDFGDEANSEVDLYLGYAGEVGKFSYDVNFCEYTYPGMTDEYNFGEAALTLGYDFGMASLSGKYYVGIDTNDVADDTANGWEPGDGWELGVSVPVPMDISLDGTYGSYDNGGTQNQATNGFGDYYSVSASKTFGKFDITVAYTGMDYDDASTKDENHFVATIATSF